MRRTASSLAAVCVLLAGGLTGCGGPAAPDADRTGIQRMLDRRAAAVRDRDAAAFLATVDRDAVHYRSGQRRVFANLGDVPLRSWEYRLTGTGGFRPVAGDGHRIAATVELRYRLTGYDTAPVITEQRLTLVRRERQWFVAGAAGAGATVSATRADGSGGAQRPAEQLWDQGDVEVVRGAHSLVLGVGQDRERLRSIAATADRAVPAVADAWNGKWARRVVIQVPASLERMAGLLGAPADGYRGIAAVTTGEIGGAGAAPADRVVVNPEAYGVLGEFGRQVVLTHETAHVATRPATTSSTPLWLSEGYADWVGYRATGRSPRAIAPELARAVDAGHAPRALPRSDDFRFGTEAVHLARAYEEGWLACRMIAESWGESKLVAFYRAVGASTAQGPKAQQRAVEAALREVLGVGLDAFTAKWRAYVRGELR
ncbi:hypothetical protein LRS74_25275 [Streptomyces sp. LX-29]|uniref:hypothetical protein n=1 Tax=Streptomyces sp. LX-29 TaxID=2900152 RepID=UPI00240D0B2D|nr:hypothetical protein [Streptomyces sp. LX-29]WFB09983.1 hypothetical protein LRS74_25275 [Streptomyces sp. LX-29]